MERVDTYTHGHHESVLASHGWRTAENSAGYLLPLLEENTDLLDVGCGPGTITVGLAQKVFPGRVMGLDRSTDVLLKASELAEAHSVENVQFEQGDVYDLPYAKGAFDVVHAHQVLQHLSDPVAALREMARVTRHGGMIAVRDADYAAMSWYPEVPGLDRWRELYHQVTRAHGAQADAGRRLVAWANKAGFTDTSPSAGVWCYAGEDDRQWWSHTWAERVEKSAFARHALDGGFSTTDELAEIATAWREWGADEDAWFAVVHGELLIRV
ncbi:methyltransferase domain-containing protein [Ruania alba]|uniref:Methyltransferase domain-containing protein n=1 Tax=Ruania alba TaxID=648782 RepID=A0A1H5HTK9_9MICO|nr:methyltransferase domain-containing protein [Ruania alba]SEE31041.1 Methyltransferase domain-containing protein [Ruania alba]